VSSGTIVNGRALTTPGPSSARRGIAGFTPLLGKEGARGGCCEIQAGAARSSSRTHRREVGASRSRAAARRRPGCSPKDGAAGRFPLLHSPTFCTCPLFSWTFSLCSLDFGISHISSGFTNKSRQQPSPWGEGGESSEPGEGVLDFLTSSFVFIDILALFPRFCSRGVGQSRRWGPRCRLPACGPSLAVGNGCPVPRPRSAHLPICLPALAFALLDFSTALGGRNHRQERENKRGRIIYPAGPDPLSNPTKEV
jgi:hypothetical protein